MRKQKPSKAFYNFIKSTMQHRSLHERCNSIYESVVFAFKHVEVEMVHPQNDESRSRRPKQVVAD